MKSKFPRPFTTAPQLTRVSVPALVLVLAANLSSAASYSTTDGYVGAQAGMVPTDAGVSGDPTLIFNVTSGGFGSGNNSITYLNADVEIKQLSVNNGYGGAQTWFTGRVHGTGNIEMTTAGRFQDFGFAGDMTGYSGKIEMEDFAGSGGTPTSTTLGYDGSNIVQFGGTTAGGTKALGTVTGSGSNRVINHVAGTGAITANVLIFNYGADASYDSVKVTNAITQLRGIHFNGNGNVEASGVIAGTGSLNSLTRSGTGTLTLSSANTYTGTTTISSGTLQLGNGGTTGSLATTSAITNNGTLAFNRSDTITQGTQFSGGAITGSGGLQKNGSGTLILNANNTYVGLTTVNSGKLIVQGTNTDTGRLQSTSGIVVNSGATLELGSTNMFTANHSTAMDNSRVLTINNGTLLMNDKMDSRIGNVTLHNGSTWTSDRGLTAYDVLLANVQNGATTQAATVLVTGNAASTMNGSGGIHLQGVQNFAVADVTGNSAADLTVSMILGSQGSSAGAAGGIHKSGAGTMVLSAANTYTGATTISGGTLTIDSSGTINSSNAITIQGGELNYNSSTALSKASTFSGTGGTLSGTGTITPVVTVTNGNTYTAGALGGVGTQKLTGGVKFESGSIFSWDITGAASDTGAGAQNSGSYDKVTGTATGSAAILNIVSSNGFSSAFWDSDKSWNNLFTTGSLSGIFSSITGSGIVWSGGQGSVANQGYFTTSGSNLNWTAVPEPTSALAGLLLGAGLLRRRRRVACS